MTQIQHRQVTLETRGSGSPLRASFSSEALVERFFGQERLLHTSEAINLERAKNGLSLLFNHDPDQPIGRVQNIRLEKGRLVGDVQPGNSARAKDVWQDIDEGILPDVSIGYRIDEIEPDPDEPGVFNVTRWTPFELTVTPVPADYSVGFGRSLSRGNTMTTEQHQTRSERINQNRALDEERERVSEILAIGKKHGQSDAAQTFVRDGRPLDEFREFVLERMHTSRPIEASLDVDIGMSPREVKQFSLVRAVNAAIDKDWSNAGLEREASLAVAQKLKRQPQGFFVPSEVLMSRDLNIGTATAGGHLVPTDHLGESFIDVLRARIRVIEMGATILNDLSGNVAIPRKTSASTAYWVAEGIAPTESQPAFDQVTLAPNTVGGFTDYTRKMLLQSSPDIENLVRNDLALTLATEIDRVAINGSGTGAEPTGILNTSGIGDVAGGTNGLAPTWDHIVALEGEVSADNADTGNLGYMSNSAVRKKLKTTTKVSGDAGAGFVWEPGNQPGFGILNGYRAATTNNVPNDLDKGTSTGVCSAIIFGNFTDLLIGYWSVLDVTVDPYTFSSTGSVRIVALQDVDIAVRHAESFAAMLDALTA